MLVLIIYGAIKIFKGNFLGQFSSFSSCLLRLFLKAFSHYMVSSPWFWDGLILLVLDARRVTMS